ncbi:MAG: metallopeptidase TldD-related protein [Myxococcota bacterium]
MDADVLAERARDALVAAGAHHAQAYAVDTQREELNAEWNEPSLLRSTFESRVVLIALVDDKKGAVSCNDTTEDGIQRAAAQAVQLAEGSRPDPANAIAPTQAEASFESGPSAPSLDGMHERMVELLAHRAAHHPKTTLRSVVIDYTRRRRVLVNTNGVRLRATIGAYDFVATFSARREADTSSFNYTGVSRKDLDRPVAELGSFDRLMGEAAQQLDPQKAPGKFTGDLVVTPDCLGSFLSPLTSYLSDDALISGTSVFADQLGQRIAHPSLTLRSLPRWDGLAVPCFFTRDGQLTEDCDVIAAGVLQRFLLSRYGALKTGHERAPTDGGSWVVEGGETPLDQLIGQVERGVLICRFSGGRPTPSGDFSGIAKNSFLIENGRIGPALSETMVSGNLIRLFEQVAGLSKERVDFGDALLPWVRLPGVTIS